MNLQFERAIAAGLRSQLCLRKAAHHRSKTFKKFPLADTALTIPARFVKQVAAGPSRLAVKTASDHLTYQELNDMANRVAWAVLEDSKAAIVPVVLDQGIRAIAAILGVLKAGRTYLHLDPSALPLSVVERVLKRFETSTIVSDKETSLAANFSIPWIDYDEIDHSRVEEPDVEMSTDDVAQFLLTSGSTGDPKIIYHTHRTALTSSMNSTNYFHVCPEDQLALFASGTGQASNVMFSSLLNGASAHHMNVRKESFLQVAERIVNDAITICFSSVTLFRHLLKAVRDDQVFPDMRLVRLGSEPAYRKDFELWKRHFSDKCVLMNGLATSEAGVALEHYVDRRAELDSVYLPVGRPVEGVRVTIEDEAGHSVGVNEVGEIVIESGAVALGYWGHPDLTAAVFDKIETKNGTRVYRTNDLGRMRVDGAIEHLGRKDFRARIRGTWVDLGEVEQTLMGLAHVQAAVVVPYDDAEHQRLVAYVVPSNKFLIVISELRLQVESVLAQAMLPTDYVIMERLPMNAAGKIDRASLPAPERSRPSQGVTSDPAPRTDTEHNVAAIWAEVFGLDSVGIRERFLDLGGDSLLAFRIIAHLHGKYGIEVPVDLLFDSGTIEEMALVVDEHCVARDT